MRPPPSVSATHFARTIATTARRVEAARQARGRARQRRLRAVAARDGRAAQRRYDAAAARISSSSASSATRDSPDRSPWRLADCAWAKRRSRGGGAGGYAKLIKPASAEDIGDVGTAMFRIAEVERTADAIARSWSPIPRIRSPPAPSTRCSRSAVRRSPRADRIERAKQLTAAHLWDRRSPSSRSCPNRISDELAAQRDYWTRHDAVRDAPALRRCRQAAARRLREARRQGRRGDVSRRARAVAGRSRRRRDRLVPQGRRQLSAHRVCRGSAVPVGLARVQPRPLPRSDRAARGFARALSALEVGRRLAVVPRHVALFPRRVGRRARQARGARASARRARRRQGRVLARAHRSAPRHTKPAAMRRLQGEPSRAIRSRGTRCSRARGSPRSAWRSARSARASPSPRSEARGHRRRGARQPTS